MRHIDSVNKNITAQISINGGKTSSHGMSMYDDDIEIQVYDKASGVTFLEMHLTREQFINAVMNKLYHTDVKEAIITDLDRVGKKVESKSFEVEFTCNTFSKVQEYARKEILKQCPKGWVPDLSLGTQGSIRSDCTDGRTEKYIAHTIIRRWIDE